MASVNTVEFWYGINLPTYNGRIESSPVDIPVCDYAEDNILQAFQNGFDDSKVIRIISYGTFDFYDASGQKLQFWAIQKSYDERSYYIPHLGIIASERSRILREFYIHPNIPNQALVMLRPVIYAQLVPRPRIWGIRNPFLKRFIYHAEILKLSNQLFNRNDEPPADYYERLRYYWSLKRKTS